MKVVWLSSYPKSGNTYIRMLLHTYLFGDVQGSGEVEEKIQDLHNVLTQKKSLVSSNDQQIIVKTHFCLADNHPYASSTVGYIYIFCATQETSCSVTQNTLEQAITQMI